MRRTNDDEWGTPVHLGPTVNTGGASSPAITGDGLRLYFVSARTGGYGQNDIWVTTRESKDSPWGPPENLGSPPNTDKHLWNLGVSFDGLEVYFSSGSGSGGYGHGTNGGHDIWVTKRASKYDQWSEAAKIGPTINGPDLDWENGQALSSDGLTIIFSSSRLGGFSTMTDWNLDLWMARRETKESPWGEAVNLGPSINTRYSDMASSLSADGRMLYFWQRDYEGVRPGGQGGKDIWQAPIVPLVDFTGDGKVDGADICTMVDCWGTDDSACDIGPMPWGDGIVDVQDLRVLAEYIGEPVGDPTLVAHWAFDETEGVIAAESIGGNDAMIIMGAPLWHPEGGAVDGALELNGTTFLMIGSAPDLTGGPFSVLAWVKGGAPGQGIITQQGGIDWLKADIADGTLMTELLGGRLGGQLRGETVITDGDWHRIAIASDASTCTLYVDDVPVAQTTQDGPPSTTGKLLIGCGKTMAPNTFFTGLIDDVRIYNRAVKP